MSRSSSLLLSAVSFVLLTATSVHAQIQPGDWRIQRSDSVSSTPEEICSPDFNDSTWIPAKVPGTVLGAYVDAGLVPDPFYGDNMDSISESSRKCLSVCMAGT